MVDDRPKWVEVALAMRCLACGRVAWAEGEEEVDDFYANHRGCGPLEPDDLLTDTTDLLRGEKEEDPP